MSKLRRIAFALSALLVLVLVGLAWAGSSSSCEMNWHVLSGGGGPASSGNISLNFTVGQAVIGSASSSTRSIDVGYWYGTSIWTSYLPIIVKSRP